MQQPFARAPPTHQREGRSLLTESELAMMLQISPKSLRNWRVSGRGPRFIKVGRLVRYAIDEVNAWIADQAKASTSQ